MIKEMANGTIRPKGAELFERFGKDLSLYGIAKRAALSQTTVHRWKKEPETISQINGEVLYGILIDGFGISADQLRELKFGDILDVVTYQNENGLDA